MRIKIVNDLIIESILLITGIVEQCGKGGEKRGNCASGKGVGRGRREGWP